MKKQYNVAIIIYCKNNADTVVRAIESAAAQNYPHRGIVVVDDGSEDKSWGTIRGCLAKRDKYEPNLLLGTLANGTPLLAHKFDSPKGIAAAKNIAVNSSLNQADVFQFLLATDTLEQEKVGECLAVMDVDEKAIGLIYSNQRLVNNQDLCVTQYLPSYSRRQLERENYIEPNHMITKMAFMFSGKYDDKQKDPDHEMLLRITQKFIGVQIPKVLSTHLEAINEDTNSNRS